jgi:hypothetical protein
MFSVQAFDLSLLCFLLSLLGFLFGVLLYLGFKLRDPTEVLALSRMMMQDFRTLQE